jgi:hypothetical protein
VSKRDDFQKTMETKLALGRARLEALRQRSLTEAETPRRERHERHIASWQARGDAAAAKLEELKTIPRDQWDVVKHEMARELYDLDGFMTVAEAAE